MRKKRTAGKLIDLYWDGQYGAWMADFDMNGYYKHVQFVFYRGKRDVINAIRHFYNVSVSHNFY